MMKLEKSLIKLKKQKILLTEKNQITKHVEIHMIGDFGDDNYNGEISLEEADEDQ